VILYKSLRYELKADPESGTLEGYGSTFGNVDEQGDIVVKGAFKRSLADMKAEGRPLKMLFRHVDLIGAWTTVKEDSKGLFVSGRPLVEDVAQAREAVALAKAGVLDELSIGIIVREFERSKDGMVRKILDADLKEVSLVPFAANPRARLTAVKCGSADCGCDSCKAEGAVGTEDELVQALVHGTPLAQGLAERVARAAWPSVYSPAMTYRALAELIESVTRTLRA
jgi:hypothetical protein